MTSVQERLRAAARAAAETVSEDNVPPLRLPADRRRAGFRPFHGRALTIAGPVAAAVALAVVAVVAAALHAAAGAGSAGTGGPAADLRQLPRYQVSLTYAGLPEPGKVQRTEAVVTATRTGRKIAVIAPPKPYDAFAAVTGSPDGRTYVLAAQDLVKPDQQHAATAFYELRVGSRIARLRPLATPVLRAMTFGRMALSPDGSQLAVTGTWPMSPRSCCGDAGVRIYDLATGKLVHSWFVQPPRPTGKCCQFGPAVTAPSWQADGRHLAVDVTLAHCEDCVALLDTAKPGSTVQAISKVIVRTHNRHYQVGWTNTLIAPDGSRVLRSALVWIRLTRRTGYYVPHVFSYSPRSGRTITRLRGPRRAGWDVVWTSQDGQAFVVATATYHQPPPGYLTISAALYRHGHWTPVRIPPQAVAVAW